MLKWALIPLGLLTAIVLAVPQLVIVGYFFLILPGLILTLIPTVFVYLLATVLIQMALPLKPGALATTTSLLLALGLGVALMLPWRIHEQRRFASTALPDVVPDDKLLLTGAVLVDWPQLDQPSAPGIACDFLCTTLLDTPGVESVTRCVQNGSATFRRGAASSGILVMPHQPQEILDAFAKLEDHKGNSPLKTRELADRALQAEWALRIALGDELRRDRPLQPADVDWTIRYVTSQKRGQPEVHRLEVLDRQEKIRARKSRVRHRIPSLFFHFGFEGGSAGDGFSGAKFVIGQSEVFTQSRYFEFDPALELLQVAEIPRPNPPSDCEEVLEYALQDALTKPDATQAQLLLAPMWLAQFRYDAGAEQMEMIARILMDARSPDPYWPLQSALSSKADLTPLRAGLARRFLCATEPRAKSWYMSSLVSLPDGTFANPTADERAIWGRATDDNAAAPFVERMADQGAKAVPELLALLDENLDGPWHARWHVLQGIREAFKRLGIDGAAASPRIMELMARRRSPLLNSADDRTQWLVALRLLGVPARDLPYAVNAIEPVHSAARRIEDQVRRYKAEREAQAAARSLTNGRTTGSLAGP